MQHSVRRHGRSNHWRSPLHNYMCPFMISLFCVCCPRKSIGQHCADVGQNVPLHITPLHCNQGWSAWSAPSAHCSATHPPCSHKARASLRWAHAAPRRAPVVEAERDDALHVGRRDLGAALQRGERGGGLVDGDVAADAVHVQQAAHLADLQPQAVRQAHLRAAARHLFWTVVRRGVRVVQFNAQRAVCAWS